MLETETKTSESLFDVANKENVEVLYINAPVCKSLSVPGNIGMDYSLIRGGASEKIHLAHELGHCITGSFYNRYASCDVRQQHENRADKWAIEKLVSKIDFLEAINAGYTQFWQLAEKFNLTEEFIKKVSSWYLYGNLYTY